MTDAEILSATRRDPDAFAVFYDRYETAIVGYFLRRTKDAELAADLTAEVFAAALSAAARDTAPRTRPLRPGYSRSLSTLSPAVFAAAKSKPEPEPEPEPDISLASVKRLSSSPARSIKFTPRSPVTNGSGSSSPAFPTSDSLNFEASRVSVGWVAASDT